MIPKRLTSRGKIKGQHPGALKGNPLRGKTKGKLSPGGLPPGILSSQSSLEPHHEMGVSSHIRGGVFHDPFWDFHLLGKRPLQVACLYFLGYLCEV